MPEPSERYSPERALEEATRLQELMDSNRARSYAEADKITGPESEPYEEHGLTPEAVERIMQKMIDIDQPGSAFTSIGGHNLLDPGGPRRGIDRAVQDMVGVLHHGVLGKYSKNSTMYFRTKPRNRAELQNPSPEGNEPARSSGPTRYRSPVVHFHIVGRSVDPHPERSETAVQESSYARNSQITVFFRLDRFEETDDPIDSDNHEGDWNLLDTFPEGTKPMYHRGWGYIRSWRKDGTLIHPDRDLRGSSDPDTGYVLKPGIPPELVIGSCVAKPTPENIRHIVAGMKEIGAEHPERLMPLYDPQGNLVWPKRISHDAIKQLLNEKKAAEKDANEG